METFAQAVEPRTTQSSPSSKSKLKYLLFGVLFLILAAAVVGSVVFFFSPKSTEPFSIVAKVGEENIYRKDLDYERSQLPPNAKVEDKEILDKMVTDSVILQSGQKMNYATLDKSVFNDPNKDYNRRITAVDAITKRVKSESITHLSGTAILIFFINNSITAPKIVSYDKAKELTLEKITKIHKDLVDKKITTKEAAGRIINDSSLAQIDASYKSNAAYVFDVEKGQKATLIKALDDELWQLPENGISDIYTDKGRKVADKNAAPTNDETFYTFVVLDKKVINENNAGFEDWLAKQKKAYEVKYF